MNIMGTNVQGVICPICGHEYDEGASGPAGEPCMHLHPIFGEPAIIARAFGMKHDEDAYIDAFIRRKKFFLKEELTRLNLDEFKPPRRSRYEIALQKR